jgi:DNA uptake protein ComE-like DNA-binding protein
VTNMRNKASSALAHLKRVCLTAILVGMMGVGLAACDQGTPSIPATSTPQAQAIESTTSTPVAAIETATPGGVTDDATPTPVTPENTTQPAACDMLNLNTVAEAELLATIPGFSARMVREFLEYRPYVSIRQFRQEIGKYVDENQIAEYEKYVYVPVDVNDSDAETLKQIPGVDDAVAAKLIAGRPYSSSEAFLDALAAQVTGEQLAEAACYLGTNP